MASYGIVGNFFTSLKYLPFLNFVPQRIYITFVIIKDGFLQIKGKLIANRTHSISLVFLQAAAPS